ncbi:MAG: ribbon-helix-helix protein, CopG family [Acidobacteria bacterium]|nr:ribbon-helix-helix protein, CopG family [Acidobacteriota bacterium]
MRRITIRLDEQLYAQAKELAARDGCTLSSLIEKALRAFLAYKQRRIGIVRRKEARSSARICRARSGRTPTSSGHAVKIPAWDGSSAHLRRLFSRLIR